MEKRAVAWIDRFGLYASSAERATLLGSASADFYSRFAPHADRDGLLIATRWVYWGFAFDDRYCDAGPMSEQPDEFARLADRLQEVLESPSSRPPTDPFGAALHDIARSMRELASPAVNERFYRAHRSWLSGVVQQIAHRANGVLPELDTYLEMRIRAAGGFPTFALLEVANGLPDIPEAEMSAPAVRTLTELASMIAALDNDRYSHSREVDLAHTDQNIYQVIRAATGDSPPEATLRAANFRDRLLERFLEVRHQVFPPAGESLRRYLLDLGHGLRGNVEWGLRAARYARPAPTVTARPMPPVLHRRPRRSPEPSVDPLALPHVARWWDPLPLQAARP
ncbi:hypothetical protein O7626_13010 [Micromonospora sp. WMMD1102]|uniref:terpene synthase family protein n=1 Tax=Micromonospora sp. WMMD1102 TaxID=3016105 RepID=UPI0024152FDD|nr:hypothetical protein [Micromonospora sp. WMMD1102]MDG4786837.1 hypothetical protein [Micromonospora sp. WMMD1102]